MPATQEHGAGRRLSPLVPCGPIAILLDKREGLFLGCPLCDSSYPYLSIWSRQDYGRNEYRSSVSRRTTDAYHARQRSFDAMALLEWLIVAAAAFGGLVALMYVVQRSLMYFPERLRTAPAIVGLPKEVALDTEDDERAARRKAGGAVVSRQRRRIAQSC